MIDPRSLSLLWPSMLWLLLAVPLLGVFYLRMMRRRRLVARRYASLETVSSGEADAFRAPGGGGGAFRDRGGLGRWRHVPAILLLLGLASLIFSITRPSAIIMLPSRVETVMLAMDVSGSMRADDVKPNRISAAQAAAKTFVDEQPGNVRVGVVSIAGAAAVVQSPTDNREDIFQTIDRFQLQRGTALGSGILISLATLLPGEGINVEKILNGPAARPEGRELGAAKSDSGESKPVPPGSNTSAVIVLLSDGHSNIGPDPLKMASMAADRGVRIFTVGIGTPEGAVLTTDGWSMRVKLDEDTLKKIATMTGGEYFRAGNAPDLKKIYKYLSAKLAFEKHQSTEVTAIFVGLGAALAMLAVLMSLLWFNRIL